MQCNKPITLFHVGKEYYPLGLKLPCGKCLGCRIKKRQEWSLRMLHELSYHDKSVFLTLTYSDENIPEGNSLRKRDLQLFFKRIRKEVPNKIKYFACGEYGTDTLRPHYHAIVYGLGLNENDKKMVREKWPFCDWNVQSIRKKSFGLVEADSIRYVAQYIDKKLTGDLAKEFYQNKEPVFAHMSKGIGKHYALDNKQQIINNMFLTHRGKKTSIPRYYINKLNLDTESIKQHSIDLQSEEVLKQAGIYLTPDELYLLGTSDENIMYLTSEQNKMSQRDKNLQAKTNLSKRQL